MTTIQLERPATIKLQFQKILDSLSEGIQVIDFKWRYLYANKAVAWHEKTTIKDLLGYTMMEKFPGIECTDFFKALKQCMQKRKPQYFNNEFVFPDRSIRWFEFNIKPVDQGILIQSSDVTELTIAVKQLAFQNKEKEKIATELITANKELAFQNKEKENRAAELVIANKELIFQNKEKENRAAEVIIAKIKKQLEITDAVIKAQEQEQSLFGEELHDNINQILATSKLYMEVAIADDNVRKDLLKESRHFIITAMEEIRKLSKSLLPPSLGEISLPDALSDMIENLQTVNKFKFIKKWKGLNEKLLNTKLSLAIYRIVQEQLNNILKHAKANTVTIGLKQHAGTIQLIIKDDGVGFDTTEKKKGVGIKNIVSRAASFNGDVKINSQPGKGCELIVNLSTELPGTGETQDQ